MKLTVLMYHKVDELPSDARYPGNYVTPRQFEQQMDALTMWGYRTISLEQWLDYRDGRLTSLPARPLVLTFDDGYTCFDRNAWPVMRERGMRATVFLVAGQIGGFNAWDSGERRESLLGASRIRALQAEGVHFGSHSVNHPALGKIEPRRAARELTESRAVLSDLLGRSIDTFAYPFSNQNRDVRAMVRDAGYRCAVRGKGRMNWKHTDPLGLRRIKVDVHTSVAQLRRTLFRERYFRVF
jgi:peptidoglycan/xylan/chitin deacetylase (PgdA/CDA1 family)